MKKLLADMAELHRHLGNDYTGSPRFLDEIGDRASMLEEEVEEYKCALIERDLEGALDALLDLIAFAVGNLNYHGFESIAEEAWDRVHSANMKKLPATPERPSKRGRTSYDSIKPEGWEAPVFDDLIARATNRMGKFIVLEGADGSGKSTQVETVSRRLTSVGLSVKVIHEPGGSELGQGIRALLKDPRFGATSAEARRFLFAADRVSTQDEIRRIRYQYDVIISDRFNPISELAYANAEGSDVGIASELLRIAPLTVKPDLVVLLNVSRAVSSARHANRGKAQDPAERDPNIMSGVLNAYDSLAETALRTGQIHSADGDKLRACVVDGSGDREDVATRIIQELSKLR